MIKIRLSAIDGSRETRTFKTLTGAQRYAARHIDANGEFGPGYAVSSDGIVTIRVIGATLHEILPNNE